jgi:hypothetical protein
METVQYYARQGDLVIDRRADGPSLEVTASPTVIAGSHGDAHAVPAGVEYGRDGRTHFVRPKEDIELTHGSRHKPVPLRAGQLYAIWPQIERRGDGDQDVED